MLAEVRVPPDGDAADGVTGADLDATDVELRVACLCVVAFLFDDLAETLNVPIEIPAIHKRTPTKVRAVTKADKRREDELILFFMGRFGYRNFVLNRRELPFWLWVKVGNFCQAGCDMSASKKKPR